MTPLAYFITFSTYGTWLHGNQKGSVDRKHNAYRTPFVERNPSIEAAATNAMTQSPYVMGPAERNIVCDALVELCRERGWLLFALHVRTNHVHAAVRAERDPGRVLSDMKARASRELTRAGFGDANRIRWTRHGSTQYLYRDDALAAKINYTLEQQGERMAYYDRAEELRST